MAYDTEAADAGGRACFSCGSQRLSIFYQVRDIPVNSCIMLPSREAALEYPTGQMSLAFCENCGFIQNTRFDAALAQYSATYEETQGFSPRFTAFARELAADLVEKHDLHQKEILEIGCGKGEFLAMLCEMGGNYGVGIDPSYIEGRLRSTALPRMSFITDFYSEKYAHLTGDFVCCRHTLEHIQEVQQFLRLLRRTVEPQRETTIFFEVPDVSRVLRECAFWDIYYEHCSYFSLGSLARLFRATGFEVLELSTEFDKQYLCITARPTSSQPSAQSAVEDDLEQLASDVAQFQRHYQENMQRWKRDLARMKHAGQKVVLWGSGSKAVAYLTTLHVRDEIEFVVDINPFKHGRFLAHTGHEIVPPSFLQQYQPDVVIAVNPIYRQEIGRNLSELGVSAELMAL